MVPFNLDKDLEAQLRRELKPTGEVFRSLPVVEQLRRIAPYLEAQKARERERFELAA